MKLTASVRVIFFLLGLSLLALAVTGSPVYSRLSYLWLFLLAGNWAWAAIGVRGIKVQRTARTLRAEVGHVFEEQFVIDNTLPVPRLWLEVRDESPLPDSQGSRVITLLPGRQARSYRAMTRLTRRGVFPLGPTVIASGDPFGLFPVSRRLPTHSSLLVYPMIVHLPSFPSPAGLLPGGEALRRRTHQITPNASGVRDYAPGDPLNRIHWVSTARRRRLMVKEFELDPMAQVWIFVDAAQAAQAAIAEPAKEIDPKDFWRAPATASLRPSTEEYTASIAASLARHFLRRGRAVGFVSSGATHDILPAETGGRQLGKILEALALFRAEGDLPILALITAQAKHLPRGSTIVVITPSVEQEVEVAIDYVQQRGLRPVAVLLDAASFGGAPGTAELAAAIKTIGVPVRRIACGDKLEKALP
ncbi:MAG: DUF58 domain-containing protein [Chloroflexota bacterium]